MVQDRGETYGIRSAERSKVTVLGMKCSRSVVGLTRMDIELGKGKVFYGQEPPSGESITTECEANYQLLSAMY